MANKADAVWKAILPDVKAKMIEIAKELGKLLGKKGMADMTYYQETVTSEYEWIGAEDDMGTGKEPRYRIHIKLLEAVVNEGKGYAGYDIEISGDDEVHQ